MAMKSPYGRWPGREGFPAEIGIIVRDASEDAL